MKRILLIDDDAKIRAALRVRLKHAGYQVQTAVNGFEGLISVLKNKPDLIITDIWMPAGIGFSMAERLEELGLSGIPLIFITAGKEDGLREAAEEFGAAGFFEKPYDTRVLLEAVARTLDAEGS